MKMRHLIDLILLAVLCFSLYGCGGTDLFGRNSLVVVRFDSSDADDIAVSISPNSGDFDSPDACSDFRSQSWCLFTSSSTRKEFGFTTSSAQVPYFIWASNQAGSTRSGTLIVIVDGIERLRLTVNIPDGIDTHYATIFRNNVQTR